MFPSTVGALVGSFPVFPSSVGSLVGNAVRVGEVVVVGERVGVVGAYVGDTGAIVRVGDAVKVGLAVVGAVVGDFVVVGAAVIVGEAVGGTGDAVGSLIFPSEVGAAVGDGDSERERERRRRRKNERTHDGTLVLVGHKEKLNPPTETTLSDPTTLRTLMNTVKFSYFANEILDRFQRLLK